MPAIGLAEAAAASAIAIAEGVTPAAPPILLLGYGAMPAALLAPETGMDVS
jgi:hypothetical protein